MLRQLAHVFGLILGYAAMTVALRLADAIAAMDPGEEVPA